MNSRTLKNGTILNGKYMIESVIGEGGFGITYKATDLTLNETVAIKEYFPSTLATRDTTTGKSDEITVITGEGESAFKKGVRKFEDEAANLAKFRKEPGIVGVKTFFHENNTGYMVMEYIDGITLKEYLEKKGGKVAPEECKKIMGRILNSLSVVHKAGIIHRDISPDNIMITPDGQGKLIDFGAARFVGNEDEKSLTVILKEGYAPPEQYHSDGKQGPWTDIYAICATLYRMVSGNRPQEGSGRMMNGDKIVPLSKCAGADPVFSRTIEKGMSIEAGKRYQTVEKLVSAFDGKKIPWKYYVIAGGVLAAMLLVGVIVLAVNLAGVKKNDTEGGPINSKEVKEDTKGEIDKEKERQNEEEIKVDEEKTTATDLNEGENQQVLYAARHIKIYSQPEEEDEYLIGLSSVGESFDVLGKENTWFQVEYENKTAYLNTDYLVNLEDFNTWKENYLNVLSIAGVDYDNENGVRVSYSLSTYGISDGFPVDLSHDLVSTDELLGVFDDFDGDGTKELFISLCGNNGNEVWYSKDGNARSICDCRDMPSSSTYVVEVWNKINAGRTILLRTGVVNCMDNQRYEHFMVSNGEPIQLSMGLKDFWGWPVRYADTAYPFDYIKCYTKTGEITYLRQSAYRFFPSWILDGEIGECASCEISESEFYSIPGAQNIVDDCTRKWLDDYNGNWMHNVWFLDLETGEFQFGDIDYYQDLACVFHNNTIDAGQSTYPQMKIEEIVPSSFQYNEAGYFVINFDISVDWKDWISDTYTATLEDTGCERIIDSNDRVKYIYTDSKVEIDKVTGYALVSYLNGKLETVYFFWGEQPLFSGEVDVWLWSDFSHFDINEVGF